MESIALTGIGYYPFSERLMTQATRLNCRPKISDLSGVIAAKTSASAAVDPAAFEAHAWGLMVPDEAVCSRGQSAD